MRCCATLSMPIALMLLLAMAAAGPARTSAGPAARPKAASARPPGDPFALLVHQVEAIYGKPLTESQRKAVIAAAMERARARTAAQDRFRASVARALGLSVQQLAAKEKAAARVQSQRRGGKP